MTFYTAINASELWELRFTAKLKQTEDWRYTVYLGNPTCRILASDFEAVEMKLESVYFIIICILEYQLSTVHRNG